MCNRDQWAGPPSGVSIGRLSGNRRAVGLCSPCLVVVGSAGGGVPLGAVPALSWCGEVSLRLAFTRYCVTSRLMCTNQSSFIPSTLAFPTLLHYYCTTIAQYTTPPSTPLLYALHHTIWIMATSCKGQLSGVNSIIVIAYLG